MSVLPYDVRGLGRWLYIDLISQKLPVSRISLRSDSLVVKISSTLTLLILHGHETGHGFLHFVEETFAPLHFTELIDEFVVLFLQLSPLFFLDVFASQLKAIDYFGVIECKSDH